jgi:transposase-like protein
MPLRSGEGVLITPLGIAISCVHARIHDTADIAQKTGIHEHMIYRLWIRHHERRHRLRERDKLQTAKQELIR